MCHLNGKMPSISSIFKGTGDIQNPKNIYQIHGKMLKKLSLILFNYPKAYHIITNFQSGFFQKDLTVN